MDKKEIEELQRQMTYNENGEGVINGKTIRELETESLKKLAENQQNDVFDSIFKNKLKNQLRKNRHKYKEKKVTLFFKNNIEIIIGIGISLLFVFVYYLFKTNGESSNASLLSGLIGCGRCNPAINFFFQTE